MWGMLPRIDVPPKAVATSPGRADDDGPPTPSFPRRLVVMGGPASGKGTQCQAIADARGMVHLSTGDMLRRASASDDALRRCMERGELVSDDAMVRLVLDRLDRPDCRSRGWILDGFPRTAAQARALRDAGLEPEAFVFLNVPDDVAIGRVAGRRTDPITGRVYNLDWNPPPDGEVLRRLIVREDDTAESMRRRLRQFRKNANAVKGCYDDIVEIDGRGSPHDVRDDIEGSLELFAKRKSTGATCALA